MIILIESNTEVGMVWFTRLDLVYIGRGFQIPLDPPLLLASHLKDYITAKFIHCRSLLMSLRAKRMNFQKRLRLVNGR